jgi:hypothetical protein
MHSRALIYVLIAAAWIAFIVGVMIVQDRDQKRLQEPRVDEPDEPAEPPLLEAAA